MLICKAMVLSKKVKRKVKTMSYPIGTKLIAIRETDHFEFGQIGKVVKSKKMLSRGGIAVEFVIGDVTKTVLSSVTCWKKVKTMKKFEDRKNEVLRKLCGLSAETVSYMNCYCFHENKCTVKLVNFVSILNKCIRKIYECTTESELLELEDMVVKFDEMMLKVSK